MGKLYFYELKSINIIDKQVELIINDLDTLEQKNIVLPIEELKKKVGKKWKVAICTN